MAVLRHVYRMALEQALENSMFSEAAFDIRYGDSESSLVRVTFKLDRAFYCSFFEICSLADSQELMAMGVPSGDAAIGTSACCFSPGYISSRPVVIAKAAFDDFLRALGLWLGRIAQDVYAQHKDVDVFERLKSDLKDQFKTFLRDPDEKFSSDEVERIEARLNEFSHRLEEYAANAEITAEALYAALRQIEDLKQMLSKFPQGTWFDIASSKIPTILKKMGGEADAQSKLLSNASQFWLGGPKG